MLELLATHQVYDAAGGSPTLFLTDLAYSYQAIYDDAVGLLSSSTHMGGFCISQLDGATYLKAVSGNTTFALDMQRPGEWLLLSNSNSTLSEFNKLGAVQGAVVASGGASFVAGVQVRALDRYLAVLGQHIQYKPLDLSGSWTNEATLSISPDTHLNPATISRTRADNIIAIAFGGGAIFLYDVDAREEVAVSWIDDNLGAWYSPKHDIYVALDYTIAPNRISVYANAVQPAVLSNPSAVNPIAQGRVSQVRVQLLGADSDPCEGELVDWSITAGLGTLAQAQSETDADGYAYNDYIAPVSGGAGSPFGNVTIQAQVLF